MTEWLIKGKPSILGFCSGIVAGLVVITPAAGFVTPNGAMIIGILAGIIPFLACWKLKAWLGYDDAWIRSACTGSAERSARSSPACSQAATPTAWSAASKKACSATS
jgi:hypothetical protein